MATANPAQLKLARDFGQPGILFDLALLPDSGRIVYGSSDFQLYEFDTRAEKPEPVQFDGDGHQSYVTSTVRVGNRVVSGSYDGQLIWWDLESKQPVRKVAAHELWIRDLAVSPDTTLIASVADDMRCKLWDAETGQCLQTLEGHATETPHHYPSMLYAVTISADGNWLATGDKTGRTIVWELPSGKKAAEIETPVMYTWDPRQRRHSIGGIRSLGFSHDSRLLAIGGIGQIGNIDHLGGPSRVEVFDWQKNERLHELEDDKHKGLVEQLVFHPDGAWFLAAGGDHNGFVTFYDADSGKIIKQEKAPMHVHGVAFDATYETLYGVGHGKIAVWELKDA